jgi:cytoskeletal protein RodZ
MKKETDKNEISLEALTFRVVVFVAVLVGIVQFFNIMYNSVHDQSPPTPKNIVQEEKTTDNSTEKDSVKKEERFIQASVNLSKPEQVYEHKDLKEKEMIKPDKGLK